MDVCKIGDLSRHDVGLAGGKGASLSELVRAGFMVPPGFIVCADAFAKAMQDGDTADRIAATCKQISFDDNDALSAVAGDIRDVISRLSMPTYLVGDICQAYRELSGNRDCPVAVRSSATCEDLREASFAGQQATFLYVRGKEDLLDAARECWASLFSARAMFYRNERGFGQDNISIAVVVQKMINADRSGVMFTVNPVTNDRDCIVIEGTWGLGEALVSGIVTPDSYIVDKRSGDASYVQVGTKEVMIVPNEEERGTVRKAVSSEKRNARVLSDEEVRELVDVGRRLEQYMGCPQDIEWGIEGGRLYVLQSRAVTTL